MIISGVIWMLSEAGAIAKKLIDREAFTDFLRQSRVGLIDKRSWLIHKVHSLFTCPFVPGLKLSQVSHMLWLRIKSCPESISQGFMFCGHQSLEPLQHFLRSSSNAYLKPLQLMTVVSAIHCRLVAKKDTHPLVVWTPNMIWLCCQTLDQ